MRNVMDLKVKSLVPDKFMTKEIVRLGLPSGATQAIFSLSSIIVQALTNSFGTTVIACSTVVMRVDGFAMMPNFTFGQTMSVYTGQNVGAQKLDRVDMGTKQGSIITLAFATTITCIILLFGPILMGMFTNTPALIDLASSMMRIMAVGYICMGVTQVLGGIMRGSGDTVTPMWISIISTIIIRIPLAYFLAWMTQSAEYPHGHPIALYGSLMLSWVLGMLISIVVFRMGKWRKKMLRTV
jgi:putative MATE family efflux protein